ncbi:unnamed protein product [Vitrella brassicaformis CCMP3155]|uniref:2Fe-2S ferredoxin-type domain-containing protein n=1 Tax=Vitrella brassicaformis (strain CCMP3155) TaxID=1169540 RepID=A0A0G4ELQ0_VITBC|nr:unnamed protein product [Vitrella brassicaformis CCMP3155]|eukprot:CEL97897.1 unnamed protein product [Vitrella brassicaformis CCMP3155]
MLACSLLCWCWLCGLLALPFVRSFTVPSSLSSTLRNDIPLMAALRPPHLLRLTTHGRGSSSSRLFSSTVSKTADVTTAAADVLEAADAGQEEDAQHDDESEEEQQQPSWQEASPYRFHQDREYRPWHGDADDTPMKWEMGDRIKPYKGGPWPGDPNAKTYKVTIIDPVSGERHTQDVPEDRYIFFSFEESRNLPPIKNIKKMCRNGCCTTCAVRVREGEVKMDPQIGLTREMERAGYALTCVSYPRSDVVLELQDEDEVYKKQFGDTFDSMSKNPTWEIPIEDD